MNSDIPDGFQPLKRGGGYLVSLGPWSVSYTHLTLPTNREV